MPKSNMHVNIEIKARVSDQSRIREILLREKADFRGVDHQVDTYFRVPNGRLKLREGNIENSLIHYERGNESGPKRSDITMFASEPESALKEVLTRALGILVVVEKHREIFFIDNVKFHIDTVEDLGTFVEIEAIDRDGTIGEAKLLQQCRSFLDRFNIPEKDLIAVSYSDLLMEEFSSCQRDNKA